MRNCGRNMTTTHTHANVTVVVPVYKDWETLALCIASLKQYVDRRHTVLLVNDCGPEADAMEKNIMAAIAGLSHFSYERNPRNLGFVQTCNRAVRELDATDNDILLLNSDTEVTEGFLEEMITVLHMFDRHAVVCPRSNNATLLSVPLLYDGQRDNIITDSYAAWQKLVPHVPRFRTIPTGVGFCMLIKRAMIANFGLFDEVYGKGYNEENDFCSRINRMGYSVVMANRAFVFHFESKSFSAQQKTELQKTNDATLKKHYPEFAPAVEKYFGTDVHPADYFADVWAMPRAKKKVLFSLYNLPAMFNGTSEQGLSLLRAFARQFGALYDIHVLTNRAGDAFHHVSKDFPTFYIESPTPLTARYDVAIVPSQIFDILQLDILNHHALKLIVVMQDIISWRSNYLNSDLLEATGAATVRCADRIVAISNFTKNDLERYFSNDHIAHKIRVSLLGVARLEKVPMMPQEHAGSVPEDFVFIVGNHFKHKAIAQALEATKKSDCRFVVLGVDDNIVHRDDYPNVTFLKSGFLSAAFVEALYANARVIVFPSQYEGFGIPIAKAYLYHRPVIAYETEVNRELAAAFHWEEHQMTFFRRFDRLSGLIDDTLRRPAFAKELRSDARGWDDYARDVGRITEEVMAEPLDVAHLCWRWDFCNTLRSFAREKNVGRYHKRGKMSVGDVVNKVIFVAVHPVRFFKKYKQKMRYLSCELTYAYRTEGFGTSVKRVKNYITTGKGVAR